MSRDRLAPQPLTRQTLPSLTGARFVAAFVVVLFHTVLPRLTGDGAVVRLLGAGYLGVSFFFALSGFILAYTYLHAGSTLDRSAWPFWRARFARVYPVYLLALGVSAPLFLKHWLVDAWQTERLGRGVAAIVLSPFLLQAWWPSAACAWNCPGWSLSVEAFFYAIFPALGLWLAARRRDRVLRVGALVWFVALLWPLAYLFVRPDGLATVGRADEGFWLWALRYDPLVHVGEFALGIATGLTFLSRASAPRSLRFWLPAAMTVVIAVVLAGPAVPYPLLHSGLLAPLFAVAIYALAWGEGRAARVLAARPVVKLGEASYALYLLHLPITGAFQFAAKRLAIQGAGAWMLTALAVVTSIAVSLAVFEYVEEPSRRLLRSLPSSRSARNPLRARGSEA